MTEVQDMAEETCDYIIKVPDVDQNRLFVAKLTKSHVYHMTEEARRALAAESLLIEYREIFEIQDGQTIRVQVRRDGTEKFFNLTVLCCLMWDMRVLA